MLSTVKGYFSDFVSLVYPNLCASCGSALNHGQDVICLICEAKFPQTDFHLDSNNPVAKHFWGRVNLQNASSFYYFNKGSRIQHLIHQLKYKGNTDVGIKLGKLYAYKLIESESIKNVDLIIPIPLHYKKQKRRGYNQSDFIAQGVSEVLQIPYDKKSIVREHDNISQTKKTRFERWSNVENIFQIKDSESLKDKHILLVDDVVTTGATLEACSSLILNLPETRVSAITIACSMK